MDTPFPVAGGHPAGMDLGSTYGVMLLSTIVVAALYGFTVLQTLYYYEHFPKDSWILKATVAVLCALDALTLAFDCHAIYFYLILNYNNPPALQQEIWSLQAELIVTYTIVLMVQLFFVLRIYSYRPHMWYIPAALGLMALASYALVLVILGNILHDSKWAATGGSAVDRPLAASWVLGMAVDIPITVVLCWYLWSEKVAVRHKTNVMLNRIIIFLVQRGAIAAVVQVFTLAAKFISPETLIWMAFHNALSKVYTNSMLATLNARVSLRKMVMDSKLDPSKPPTAFNRPGSTALQVTTVQFASQPTVTFDSDTRSPDTDTVNSMDFHGSYPAHSYSSRSTERKYGDTERSFMAV